MSEEKKTAVTEEVKEEARKLSMEELEQVSGGNNILEEIARQAKQQLQLDREETGDIAKDFIEKYGRYYKEILPKK